jgi:ubiquinone/menaquinone biosynthesis C-methylase UbiE
MKRIELFHPRVFSDQEWAEHYHKRNLKNIQRTAWRLAGKLEKAGFAEGDILDAGCGFGAVALKFAQRFPAAKVTGVDLAEPLLEKARSAVEQGGVADRVFLSMGDVQDLQFPDNSFDLVVNSFLTHIVEDPVKMLDELERVAKPDGIIMITDLRRNWLGLFVKKLGTALTLEEALEIVGKSAIRPGKASNGPFWWDYMVGV